jgi:peptide/nickel transport system substrate-binding protein
MGLEEHALRAWVRRVAHGEASRRHFLRTLLGLGLSGPMIADLLASAAPAAAQGTPGGQPTFTPTRRGGGGKLRLLSWEGPTILNPHFASGKDWHASCTVYESLVSVNPDGELISVLAAEIPSIENGGRAPDGTWPLWRLKPGVVWHDGTPFTADDVLFTWEYATDPATAALTAGYYEGILRFDKLNDHTVKVVFNEPTPYWYATGGILLLPKHRFAEYTGANARNAPYNLQPVGTGPYKLVDFTPGEGALFELNPHYHVPNHPFFDTVELKGGGDATSAARAVVQTGECDFAWFLIPVDKDVRERMAHQGRKGTFLITPSTSLVHIQLNRTDPGTEVDGERSSVKVPHPFFSDLRVRQAFALAVDRRTIVEQIYGTAGQVTSNVLNAPPPFQSPNTRWEFNLDKAAQLLEQAGWRRGSDGVRVKDGRRMQVVYQAAANLITQKTQAIVKQALEHLGVEVELKAVPSSVMFSSDPGNPDTYTHFYADMQMYSVPSLLDPQRPMQRFVSWEMAQKANNWMGLNVVRWANAEYDRLWRQAATELDPVKRAALFIRMNDLLVEDVVVIPVATVHNVSAVSHSLRGLELGPWDWNLWNLAYWYREP